MSDTPDVSAALAPKETFLGHLANLPAMFGAISRLVGKTAAVGEAWLDIPLAEGERRSQAIRDDKAAHSALVRIIQDAAGPEAIKDPELVKRAIASWGGERLRKQANKEGVAQKAAEEAVKRPMSEDAKTPDEDWMNVFEGYAEKASSEELRSLYGRVLDGQVRKPGSFSLRTLSFMSLIDQETADVIETFSPYVINGAMISGLESFNSSPYFDKLVVLATTGLINMGSSTSYTLTGQGPIAVNIGKTDIAVFMIAEPKQAKLSGSLLTKTGQEVFSLAHGDRKRLESQEFHQYMEVAFGKWISENN